VPQAADLSQEVARAVSAPNGKIEILGGWDGMTGQTNGLDFAGGASFSLPLGEQFGLQADVAAASMFGTGTYGTTLHAFTRNPDSYLLGIVGGAAWTNQASIYYTGPEFEAYLGPVSLEAVGGYMNLNVAGVNSSKFFGIADAAFYATPDFRLVVGVKDIADFKSAHAGMEWQVSDESPISFTLDGMVGDNNFAAGNAGLKFYFGGTSKSLIDRHRKDDPRNRSLDIFGGAGTAFTPPAASGPAPPDIGICPTGEVDIDPGPGVNCQFIT
jgi:hypothetical protein